MATPEIVPTIASNCVGCFKAKSPCRNTGRKSVGYLRWAGGFFRLLQTPTNAWLCNLLLIYSSASLLQILLLYAVFSSNYMDNCKMFLLKINYLQKTLKIFFDI